ncbi:MAG: phosphatase PAP2-related protein [Chitinophagaceae bacterium]
MQWKEALKSKSFFLKIIITPGLFVVYSSVTQKLGNFVQARKGFQLDDKLLYWFPHVDYSISIFIVLYTSLFLLIVTHLNQPKVILRIIEMHFLVAIVRQLCILALPLEPPLGIIVLRDVFLENTFYPHHTPMTKDLFFSGHVASILIYYLCAKKRWLRAILFCMLILMSYMILCMKVHYTYDVYGAILFTFFIYKVLSGEHVSLKQLFQKGNSQL